MRSCHTSNLCAVERNLGNVVFLIQRFPGYGGAEEYVFQLVSRLNAAGFRCTVLTSDLDKRKAGGLSTSIRIVKLPVLFKIGEYAVWKGLVRTLFETKADIFHVNTYGYYHTDVISAVHKLRKFRTVFTAHGFHGLDLYLNPAKTQHATRSRLWDIRRLGRPFYDFTLGFFEIASANALVALSQKDVDVFRWMGADESKIHEIPLGVKDIFFEEIDEELVSRMRKRFDGDPIILSVGELSWVKGKDIPLKALAALIRRFPKARLVYVGKNGGIYKHLKELSRRQGLERNVLFEGYVPQDELIHYYSSADVLVHTSYAEGLSTILLEALAVGLPVVSTPAGGNAQLLMENKAGLVVPFNDPKSVCSAVEEILCNDRLRKALRDNGRSYAANNLTWNEVTRKYLTLYQNTVKES